ncbi:MAG: DinB family protein, partial [Acidobacteria bacterium]
MEDVIEDFRQTVEDAAGRLLAISEEEASAPRAEGKWSPKEIVGHLIDSASNNHQRFVRAQFTDHLVFPAYEQEAWVRAQGYKDEPWPLLVELWRSFNLHL